MNMIKNKIKKKSAAAREPGPEDEGLKDEGGRMKDEGYSHLLQWHPGAWGPEPCIP
jgi:hypothetical protein